MRENANDRHLNVLLIEVLLVASAEEGEAEEGQHDHEGVANLATLFPWRDLTWVGLVAQIVNSSVKPVTIAIDMEFIEVTELVEGVMLEVVDDNLVLFRRLGLILKPVLCLQAG